MENQRKLELTLCGMFPYGLKFQLDTSECESTFMSYPIVTLTGVFTDEEYSKTRYKSSKNKIGNCELKHLKPLLHSFDKLTEPILDGGLIPIEELIKITGIVSCKYPDWKLDNQLNFLAISTESYSLDFDTYFKISEKLKQWHFNIYDLPSDMYIEKSTLKQE